MDNIEQIKKEFDKILKGIDEDECEDNEGWWETSTGAEFGGKKKKELWELFKTALKETIEQTRKETVEHFLEPKCPPVCYKCGKTFKRLSKYEYAPVCECKPKYHLCIG